MDFRVLYISDSLGVPSAHRGIFNYSIALLEMLKSLGAELTLVVEQARHFGVDRSKHKPLLRVAPQVLPGVQINEVFRYFMENRFWATREYAPRMLNAIAMRFPHLFYPWNLWADFVRSRAQGRIPLDYDLTDFRDRGLDHLALFDDFLYIAEFYSSCIKRGARGTRPVSIDCRGFDLVLADSPQYIRPTSIDPTKVFFVVHDLIPLTDPFMWASNREAFFRSIDCALNYGIICVSQTTWSKLDNLMGRVDKKARHVINPTIGHRQIKASERGLYKSSPSQKNLYAINRLVKIPLVDPSLPYFFTVTSEEPRKNVEVLIGASEMLVGIANLVIAGSINPQRYLKSGIDRPSNILFAGFISDDEKDDLLSGAVGSIFPSFSEGFGIPIVESAVIGVPVICSDITVFREVASDHAFYFDPNSTDDLVRVVKSLLDNPAAGAKQSRNLKQRCLALYSQEAMLPKVRRVLEHAGITEPKLSA